MDVRLLSMDMCETNEALVSAEKASASSFSATSKATSYATLSAPS